MIIVQTLILKCESTVFMDTKVLDVLVTIVETGSLTAAAEKLGYTQPAITHMLKNLEAEVGFPILIRDKRGARLTPNGQKLMPTVYAHIKATNNFYEKAHQIKRQTEGTLILYTIQNLTINWLSSVIMYFRNDFPDIMIRIDEGKLDDAESVLDHEKADFAIVIDNEEIRRNNKIELIPLYEDSPVALLPRKHPLSDVEKFPIRAFEDYPFIMQEGFTEYMYRVILEDNGIRPSVEATTSSDINLVSRVYSGFGLSLRSAQTMTNIRHGSIITKPLDIPFTYMVCIAYRKNDNLSPSAKGFIKFMTEHNAAEDKG